MSLKMRVAPSRQKPSRYLPKITTTNLSTKWDSWTVVKRLAKLRAAGYSDPHFLVVMSRRSYAELGSEIRYALEMVTARSRKPSGLWQSSQTPPSFLMLNEYLSTVLVPYCTVLLRLGTVLINLSLVYKLCGYINLSTLAVYTWGEIRAIGLHVVKVGQLVRLSETRRR